MRIPAQGQIREVGESCAAALGIDLAFRGVAADHLRHFDIEQMRCVQGLARGEQPSVHNPCRGGTEMRYPRVNPCPELNCFLLLPVRVSDTGAAIMRITSKGQVTIPADIRERAGLLPHTEVEFEFDGKAVRILRAKPRKGEGRGARLVAHLRGRGDVALSTDAIMALTRDD